MGDNSPELAAVTEFLRHCLPFSELEPPELQRAARQADIVYCIRGTRFDPDDQGNWLRILRTGAVEVRTRAGHLLDRLGEGESINLNALAEDEPEAFALVIEDSLLYLINPTLLESLRDSNRHFDRFFHRQRARRLRRAARKTDAQPALLRPISELMHREVIGVVPQTAIADAARLMTEKRVSSLLIIEAEKLQGIVTDRDLRSRVLAQRLNYDTPVSAIMTREPQRLSPDSTVFDALLSMSSKHVHHLPIVEDDKPLGMITASDLIRERSDDPVYLVQFIARQTSTAALAEALSGIQQVFVAWQGAGASAQQLSRLLTSLSDTVTRRLIEIAERELGPAPAAYAWLGFGSQGRAEQALGGDQDNALVYADDAPAEADAWFQALAQRVCDGLAACGYAYCRGGIMATTDEWRQPLARWCQTVSRWSHAPTPDAVMRVSIFFDIRCVHGDNALTQRLQQHMLESVAGQDIFLALLARNALHNTPPLGFFRRFVLERNGEHKDTLDLKHRGIIPVVDLARVYALASGVAAINTFARLDALVDNRQLTLKDGRNLADALSFVMKVRQQVQAQQIRDAEPVSNYVDPDKLARLQREQLRDAFVVIHEAQQALEMKFTRGLA